MTAATKRLMTVAEAAALTPYGPRVLKQAIHATDPNAFPPPLKAKRGSKGQYLVTDKALDDWVESLPDA